MEEDGRCIEKVRTRGRSIDQQLWHSRIHPGWLAGWLRDVRGSRDGKIRSQSVISSGMCQSANQSQRITGASTEFQTAKMFDLSSKSTKSMLLVVLVAQSPKLSDHLNNKCQGQAIKIYNKKSTASRLFLVLAMTLWPDIFNL
ncbi:hypothetical protein ElyMa_001335400 [Elysia marginata]|uniref:Uncharacterized protein n=1 Tax=Elysia marginata TaxID=1093978 RepID=A0AAV4INV7_9GAST|nr:hypothetical protein ElyMa_001335400 [Elysia marginata]